MMDLGIAGKWALVCASSKGLGRGCAEALAQAGVNLVLNGRTIETLEATAADIRDTFGVTVITVAADVATEEGRDAILLEAGQVIFSLPMLAAHLRVFGPIGAATISSKPSTPICSPQSP